MNRVSWLSEKLSINQSFSDSEKKESILPEFIHLYQYQYWFRGLKTEFPPCYEFTITNKVFLHFTCKESNVPSERTWDNDRAIRIRWIRETIQNFYNSDVSIWSEYYRKSERFYLFIKNERYIVIMERVKDMFIVVTAFYIDNDDKYVFYKVKAKRAKNKTSF